MSGLNAEKTSPHFCDGRRWRFFIKNGVGRVRIRSMVRERQGRIAMTELTRIPEGCLPSSCIASLRLCNLSV